MAAHPPSVLIIEARFYQEIADDLAAGATTELESRGVAFERISVPGALEIPVALSIALRQGLLGAGSKHQGCIALGCVIRGETSHYDVVAGESARGLMQVAVENGLPVGNGILTVDNRAQAEMRASVDGRNKGRDAAAACLALMKIGAKQPAGARE